MKVLIIEDEPITARELKFVLRKLEKNIEILDTVDSIETALEFLNKTQPDLIFSDIHLADGTCFEIYKQIDITCPIVFCTAYDDYAIEAFQTNGVAYILKPFNEESVSAALEKVKKITNIAGQPTENQFSSKKGLDLLAKLLAQKEDFKSSFLVSKAGKLIPVDISNVAFFYIKNEIVMLHTVKGDVYMTDYTLDKLEEEINPHDFYRANRQFLINKRSVKEVDQYFARKLLVKTHSITPEHIIVSKAKATDFTNWLGSKRG
jgi:two-component system, LytTR family, response regulator LytT